jgi:CRP-like cAMP-binding protein/CheY-like chemotaxis protein
MKKILLIEDNFEMRENIAEILELADYEVHIAENGKVGVEKAKKELPHIIICDVMMPELDGYGVLYMLGKNTATRNIPFIFLTAKSEQSDFRKGMNMGADDYLTKPFDETELLEAIERRLQKHQQFVHTPQEQNLEVLEDFIEKARGLDELEQLSKNRKVRTFKKKDIIFHEGDHPNHLYFLTKGKVKTYKINEDGKEFVTELYREGDYIGFMSLLEDEEYHDTASAMEETTLCLIPRQEFLDLIHKNRDVSAKFIKMLSHNLHEKEQELIDLAYNTVRKRVADALLKLMKTFEAKTEENSFVIAISRDDLASMVGTATESVIRTLSEFKEDKLIDIKGSKITILNPEKLASMKY